MYKKTNKKLKFYKNIIRYINFLSRLIVVLILITFLYLLQKNINDNGLKNNDIIINIMESPKLQTYENDGDIVSVIGDKAEIMEDKIKIYNLNMKSDFLVGSAEIVDIVDNGEEVILKNRPTIIFYNEK